jgi:anti-sigma regulatory factor (Ser/Thr protein kinase)
MPAFTSKKFHFKSSSQSLVSALRQILDFVSISLPYHTDTASVNFKIKAIVTELLNNAIKHAGDTETVIEVKIDGKHVVIEKTDKGERFDPGNVISTNKATGETKIKLSKDALHHLYALVKSDAAISFVCEDAGEELPVDTNRVGEHFGLLIITKSAEAFSYEFDAKSGVNKFSVAVALT